MARTCLALKRASICLHVGDPVKSAAPSSTLINRSIGRETIELQSNWREEQGFARSSDKNL